MKSGVETQFATITQATQIIKTAKKSCKKKF